MLLYKYKGLSNLTDLDRLLEIIENKEIYLPTFKQLNDPFESFAHNVRLCVCGEAISQSMGRRNSSVDDVYERFGILSLTIERKNQVMWAMYANDYCGVCLAFDNLKNTRKIDYLSKKQIIELPDISEEELIDDNVLIESLFKKNDMWEKENEYRIVYDITEGQYLKFQKENLKYIIIGHKVPDKIRKVIYQFCRKNKILVYKTYLYYVDNEIYIKEYDYIPKGDGSDILCDDI